MISIKICWLGHVTPDIKKFKTLPLILNEPVKVLQHTKPNTFQLSFFLELE
jgi:hypothetical protein